MMEVSTLCKFSIAQIHNFDKFCGSVSETRVKKQMIMRYRITGFGNEFTYLTNRFAYESVLILSDIPSFGIEDQSLKSFYSCPLHLLWL